MTNKHQQIAQLVKGHLIEEKSTSLLDLSLKTDEELIRTLFTNYRSSSGRGLKLSHGGLMIMKKYFENHTIVFKNQTVFSSYHVLFLDRHSSMPWYCDGYLPITVTFFDPHMALLAKLADSMDYLMENFS